MGNVDNIRNNLREFDIINPAQIFNGDIAFYEVDKSNPLYDMSKDIFYLNAIEENGNNKYESFLNKYFYSKIGTDRIKKEARSLFNPLLITKMNEAGDGRHLSIRADFSALNVYLNDTELRNDLNKDGQVIDSDILLDLIIENYKSRVNKIKDFRDNRLNAKDPGYFINKIIIHRYGKDYVDANKNLSRYELEGYNDLIDDCDVDLVLKNNETLLDLMLKLKEYMDNDNKRSTGEFYDQMLKDFMDCFVYDKFVMCFMKRVMDQQKYLTEAKKGKLKDIYKKMNAIVDGKEGKDSKTYLELNDERRKIEQDCEIASSITEIARFFNIVDKENVKYNQSIKYYDEKKEKIEHYNTNDLRNDFKKYEKQFDEEDRKLINMPISQLDALGLTRNIENTNKYIEFLQKKDEEALVQAGWVLMAPGQKVKDFRGYAGNPAKTNSSYVKKVSDEEVEKREFVFSKTNPSRQLVGQEKFEGYIGYIYRNGLVLFERYKEEGGLKNNATYVMNIDNFIEFSKKTKTQIMDIIKNGSNTEVRRLYHTDTWEDRLYALVGSIPETEDTVMRVESLPSYGRK